MCTDYNFGVGGEIGEGRGAEREKRKDKETKEGKQKKEGRGPKGQRKKRKEAKKILNKNLIQKSKNVIKKIQLIQFLPLPFIQSSLKITLITNFIQNTIQRSQNLVLACNGRLRRRDRRGLKNSRRNTFHGRWWRAVFTFLIIIGGGRGGGREAGRGTTAGSDKCVQGSKRDRSPHWDPSGRRRRRRDVVFDTFEVHVFSAVSFVFADFFPVEVFQFGKLGDDEWAVVHCLADWVVFEADVLELGESLQKDNDVVVQLGESQLQVIS